jgi:hypothetical protein
MPGEGACIKKSQKDTFIYGRLKCLMEQKTVNFSVMLYPFYSLGVRLSVYVT